MKILVDTSVWSLALRRSNHVDALHAKELRSLIKDHRVQMIGPIRQEILSGIRSKSQFDNLNKRLAGFTDHPILTEDYIAAARYFNLCRSKGIQGSNTDFLICAVSVRSELPIYTTDKDYALFAKHIPVQLYIPEL